MNSLDRELAWLHRRWRWLMVGLVAVLAAQVAMFVLLSRTRPPELPEEEIERAFQEMRP